MKPTTTCRGAFQMWTWIIVLGGGGVHIYQVVNCPEEDSELMSAFISALDGDTFSLWSRLNGLAGRQTDREQRG